MAYAGILHRVAVEVPTSVPGATSLPGVEEALKRIVTDGGLMGAVLVLALMGIVLLWRRIMASEKAHAEDREAWQAAMQALQDKRISEMREIMSAINSSTAALSVISQTQVDRNSSSHEMAAKLNELVLITTGNGKSLDRNLSVFERGLADIASECRRLSSKQGAA